MKRPLFSIGSWAFSFGPFAESSWSFDRFMDYAASAGYDGIEINGFHPHPHPDAYNTSAKCQDLRSRINDKGLGISGYAPDFRAVPPAEASSSEYLQELDKILAFCANMQIDVLRVDTVTPPGELSQELYEKQFKQLAATWRKAAQRCKDQGVRLVWEFEPGFWLNKPSEILAIVEAVNDSNFNVLFDTSHAYMCAVMGARQSGAVETLKGGVVELAELLHKHIGHFHLIDSDGTLHNNETSTHAPFGMGLIDFRRVISSIREQVEPLNWWCFDFCFCPTTEVDARKAIPFVENIISTIE